jgi:hypothetical protein
VKAGAARADVELRDLKAKPVGLQEYRGQIVVLGRFSSESRPAAAAANAVEALKRRVQEGGRAFLGLNVGENAAPVERAEAFRASTSGLPGAAG